MLPTESELRERYATYSNNRLLSIIHNKHDYTSQALEAARAELASRDISSRDVDVFLDEQEQRELTAKLLACVPLLFWEKALFFFLWFSPWFVGGALRIRYRDDGYTLKVRQTYVFSIAGFITALVSAFIAVQFHVHAGTIVAILLVLFFVFVWAEKKVFYDLTASSPEPSPDDRG